MSCRSSISCSTDPQRRDLLLNKRTSSITKQCTTLSTSYRDRNPICSFVYIAECSTISRKIFLSRMTYMYTLRLSCGCHYGHIDRSPPTKLSSSLSPLPLHTRKSIDDSTGIWRRLSEGGWILDLDNEIMGSADDRIVDAVL